jgi:Mg2+/citrate symporter
MQVGAASLPAKTWRLVLDYGKGALLGLVLYLLLSALIFFCGFMIALGNETPWSGPILRAVGAFFVVANPLWGIPLSMVLGAFCRGRK